VRCYLSVRLTNVHWQRLRRHEKSEASDAAEQPPAAGPAAAAPAEGAAGTQSAPADTEQAPQASDVLHTAPVAIDAPKPDAAAPADVQREREVANAAAVEAWRTRVAAYNAASVSVDATRLRGLCDALVSKTSEASVDSLEKLRAQMYRALARHADNWDRTALLEELRGIADDV
jgi:hypothetical protein